MHAGARRMWRWVITDGGQGRRWCVERCFLVAETFHVLAGQECRLRQELPLLWPPQQLQRDLRQLQLLVLRDSLLRRQQQQRQQRRQQQQQQLVRKWGQRKNGKGVGDGRLWNGVLEEESVPTNVCVMD